MKRILHISILIAIILTSCANPKELLQKDLADLYNPAAQIVEPEHYVFHENDSVTRIILNLPLSNFQYAKGQNIGTATARISVNYELLNNYESSLPLDSGTYKITDSSNYLKNYVETIKLTIHTPKTGEFILKVQILDINSDKEKLMFLPIYKESPDGQQNFLVLDNNENMLFRNYIRPKENIVLYHNTIDQGTLTVQYYHRDFPVALPPFSMQTDDPFDYKSDSTFTLNVKNHKTEATIFSKPGFYHFQWDKNKKEGFTLYIFSDNFPEITLSSEILSPLRYITTQKEFDKLLSQSDTKHAADSFWLENSGNENRARSLISKYYNRVQDANKLFSSYLEGWKTDRGMIFIVFGPPNHVFRSTNTEMWIYGEAGNPQSLRFSFVRVNNPFTYNDFSLYRNPMYKEFWYRAVENWRR